MARTFALANQKGGVAKTTSVLNLSTALSDLGYRVLMVDLDPQGSLTFSCGHDPDRLELTIHDVLLSRMPIQKVILETSGPDIAPANIELAGAEMFLFTKTGREYELQRALEEVERSYDIIMIDCPPSLGILTINGLTAAQEVIIPFQCETLSQRGVAQLLETINDVRRYTNRDLKIRGILPTMFDQRVKLGRQVLDEVAQRWAIEIFEPPVPRSVRFAEAPSQGRPILRSAPGHPGAEAYRKIAAMLV